MGMKGLFEFFQTLLRDNVAVNFSHNETARRIVKRTTY